MSKRTLVLDALNNRPVKRIPVGFWFHYTENELIDGLKQPEIVEKNLSGHKAFYENVDPDFIKIMSDGFFKYPIPEIAQIKTIDELNKLEHLTPEHPWIVSQVKFVKELTELFGKDVLNFYNIFAPATYFKFLLEGNTLVALANRVEENPVLLTAIFNFIAIDISLLVTEVITKGKTDGIYLSVQNIQSDKIKKNDYKKIIEPSDLFVLEAANQITDLNILHICGFEGSKNDLSFYSDYPARAFNWANTVEGINLSEGKKLFQGKAVIGGFDNSLEGILTTGTKNELIELTDELIKETGQTGIILGADCTVSKDIDIERFTWVRDAARNIKKQK